MDELEELNGELDVAQAARAQLELPVGLGRPDVPLDPSAHRPDIVDEAVAAAALQISGRMAATYASPSSVSPATGRAFSNAWNSQVFAQLR